jgi:hypothetical protein
MPPHMVILKVIQFLGREFSSNPDKYPNGCPCGHDYRKILRKLDTLKTKYVILNCTTHINDMITIFKCFHHDIQDLPIRGAHEMAFKVSEAIATAVENNELTYASIA